MSDYPSLQLKGEIVDLDFTVDTDHRKRRRNRTTQSCLNCHTSKRKCDRKRPCQRCIQLGLTGLCVYEIDDPALRDDPTIDEATRLRNRIAELESLVRELRGKPHPRWANGESTSRDPTERWHSRAAKNSLHLRRTRGVASGSANLGGDTPQNGQAVKPEPLPSDISQPHLYRFTPSPPAGQSQQSAGYASMGYATSPPSSTLHYQGHSHHATSYDNGLWCDSESSHTASHHHHQHHMSQHTSHHSQQQYGCPCRSSPALVSLGHQLQNALAALGHHHSHNTASTHPRHPSQHGDQDECPLFRRISELSGVMQSTIGMSLSLGDSTSSLLPSSGPASGSGSGSRSGLNGSGPSNPGPTTGAPGSGAGSPFASPPYGTLPTPTDSEIHSPACGTPFHVSGSASSSSPSSPSSGSSPIGGNGRSAGGGAGGANAGAGAAASAATMDWGYNPYFPLQGMSGVGMGGMSSVGMGVGVPVSIVGEGNGMYSTVMAT